MAVPVFFADYRSNGPKRNTLAKLGKLLDAAGLSGIVRTGDLTAIKIHFGELGNDAFVSPVQARRIADAVRALGAKPFFADTNTLYSGSRSNAADHLATAHAHGFVPEVCGAPVLIADGLRGSDWREVELDGTWFKRAKIASAFLDADSFVAISHFKGHEMAGFGGAIKNIAMGCAPPAGKREQHAVKFFVVEAKCTACGTCVEVCPVGAISLEGAALSGGRRAALIDRTKCIGCGECASRCPVKAISMDWKTEIVPFTEKMTEYAHAAVKGKEGRRLFVTFVKDVVPDCDCAPWSDAPMVADLGILASVDPVAIDQAAYDLVTAAPPSAGSLVDGKAAAGQDKFAAIHPETRGLVQLEHGERIGLGSREYELVRV
ncbi:MAG TPA: DUF362 domain-containing protein [Rectinemataceae bacterium]|nr:DUF362 domain-containing protein [Rectinemataceae bacterium]